MFTLEKTCNIRELLNKYSRWSQSRSRAKVTAPDPAKYPGSGRLRLQNPVEYIYLSICLDPEIPSHILEIYHLSIELASSYTNNIIGLTGEEISYVP